jgi:hypothetical protein
LNLPKPYSYDSTPDQGYVFITDKGIKYRVYLVVDEGLFSDKLEWHCPVKQIVFAPEGERSKLHKDDSRVMITVCHIILQHILREPNLILVWICDTENERKNQAARHRLFDKFFHFYNQKLEADGMEMHKEDRHFDSDHFGVEFISLVLRKQHAFFADILVAFTNLDLSAGGI